MSDWEFEFGERVELIMSGEQGMVVGRSHYMQDLPDHYLIRYVAGDGRQVEGWFTTSTFRRIN